ncbi:unnamed protein product [Macrosiphum euphorbiae]|uniref:Transposable element P transposase-like RNase H domain-containing protein n=1 Tax=Macrosiphum euphorbiae TaxID=13131 RepID=A0AAV0WW99_9HEMI|nr:unnamed protein product [Macrosiphum euphorbiae]
MLLCLLFQIRSPSGYNFLRENKILPLPCVNSIRNHLLAVKIGCGFDLNLFKLLKKKFSSKSDFQRKGLEDYGGEVPCEEGRDKKANHGLVFMWQSLAENFTQPIAVFASNGPVKGVDLAKLIVKAIVLMEDSGGQMMGITSDRATTNRSMWNSLGVSAKKENFQNYFVNPYDSTRKVYVFSDAPYLIKTVVNRLFKNKELKIDPLKPSIKWEHYVNLFKIESNSLVKVCPKLTKHYLPIEKVYILIIKQI